MSIILMQKDFGGDMDMWTSLCEDAAAKGLIPKDYKSDEVDEISVTVTNAEHAK